MNSASLKRDSRLYLKIAGSLLEGIEDGIYKPGYSLPTIGALAKASSVSRQTAGHGMEVLVEKGSSSECQAGAITCASFHERPGRCRI